MAISIPNIGVMPAVGLGTWRLAGRECEQTVKIALELGYRHLDTADLYNNHAAVGLAIKGFPREQLFLVSKLNTTELQPKNILKACQRLLQELDTPYLDLLLIHWPADDTPAEQTLTAMVELQQQQLIRHLGVSNFMLPQLKEIEKQHFPILTNQIEIHPYLQETALTAYCQKHGMSVTAYRPIQKGEVACEPLLNAIGAHHHKTPVQVVLRWLFQRGIVSIPKASSKAHLQENIAIFDFSLAPAEMQAIASLEVGKRYVV